MIIIPEWFRRVVDLAERDPRRGIRRLPQCVAQSLPADRPWMVLALSTALLAGEQRVAAADLLAAHRAEFVAPELAGGLLIYRRLALLADQEPVAPSTWAALAHDCLAAGAPDEWLRACFERMAALNRMGHYTETLALAEQLADAASRSAAASGRLWRLRGVAQTYLGNLAEGFAAHNRAITAYVEARRPIDQAHAFLNRAWTHHRREDFMAAMADHERAYQIVRRYQLPLSTAICERDLGILMAHLGQFGEALRLTLQARAGFVALHQVQWSAMSDLNLGNITYYMGLHDIALAAYQRASTAFESISARRMLYVCRRNRAQALLAQGEYAVALDELRRLEHDLEGYDQLELAETLSDQGRVLQRLGDVQAADAVWHRAEERFLALGNRPGAAECRMERGLLALAQGDPGQAATLLQAARADLADRPIHHWRIDAGLGRCLAIQGHQEAALVSSMAAIETIARLRRRLASEYASSGLFRQARQVHHDGLELAIQRNDPEAIWYLAARQRAFSLAAHTPDQTLPAALRARESVLHDELRRLQAHPDPHQLDAALSAYSEVMLYMRHRTPLQAEPDASFEPLPIPQVRAQLTQAFPQGWLMLTFVMQADRLLVLSLGPDTLHVDNMQIDAALHRALDRACLPRYRPITFLDPEGLPTLLQLGETLIPAHVRAVLHADHRLLIVPDGRLHALPWAALRVHDRWLCEQAVVQLIPSESFWRLFSERQPTSNTALLIGCRDFGGRAAPLPDAITTLDQVAQVWPGVCHRLEDADASRGRVLNLAERGALRSYGLIHIAAHVQLSAARGLLAHIKLYDDDLFYDEVTSLGLQGALVVLAACEGALGEVLPGDEVLSLSRAFLAAGARDVVAGLWQLYDAAALALLPIFYRRLAQGDDAPTALAVAQRTLINQVPQTSAETFLSLPLVWAGLCAIGAGTRPGSPLV